MFLEEGLDRVVEWLFQVVVVSMVVEEEIIFVGVGVVINTITLKFYHDQTTWQKFRVHVIITVIIMFVLLVNIFL